MNDEGRLSSGPRDSTTPSVAGRADRLPTPRRVPRAVIELRIEQRPFVWFDAETEDDFNRLRWELESRPEEHELLKTAIALRKRHDLGRRPA